MKAKLLQSATLLGTQLSINAGTIVECLPATNIPDGESKMFIRPVFLRGIWDEVSDEDSILVNKDELFIYPECYLHVTECRSGNEYVSPITGNMILNLGKRIDYWLKKEFNGELRRDGAVSAGLEGEYFAKIMTDGRSPDEIVSWTSGGFYTKMSC